MADNRDQWNANRDRDRRTSQMGRRADDNKPFAESENTPLVRYDNPDDVPNAETETNAGEGSDLSEGQSGPEPPYKPED